MHDESSSNSGKKNSQKSDSNRTKGNQVINASEETQNKEVAAAAAQPAEPFCQDYTHFPTCEAYRSQCYCTNNLKALPRGGPFDANRLEASTPHTRPIMDNSMSLLNFQQNVWDANACHPNLQISGDKSLMIIYKENHDNKLGWRSVFAKHPILLNDSSDIFYFEISIGKMKDSLIFGFAIKKQTELDEKICNRKGTYAYENCGCRDGGHALFYIDDVIGVGINLAHRQIIFTKNGELFDSIFVYNLPESSDSLYPFVSLMSVGDQIEANFGPKFKLNLEPNCWDANDCHNELQISADGKRLTVIHNGKKRGWRSVFAKHPISPKKHSSDTFFFEISVGKMKSSLIFGFAIKKQTELDAHMYGRMGTYAYENCGCKAGGHHGNYYIDGSPTDGKYLKDSFGVGDVVGVGINLETKRIIFTKNGELLDSFIVNNFPASSDYSDSLYPFVSLYNSRDQIEANFGPTFKFDLTTI
ncbi:hypothetical protein niasHS_005049 [Heterodera schachtii]|uniref:B30.2/SPRY domain-containing protein n=1 Tax=Heterodera schachtii TaxID=97005 RepID=A0ABD2JKD0_HETSC